MRVSPSRSKADPKRSCSIASEARRLLGLLVPTDLALRIAQQKEITDIEGRSYNWREELIDAIVSRQREDGGWQNEADRWLEGEPVLATVYSLLRWKRR